MQEEKTGDYFRSVWNWIDNLSALTAELIIIVTLFELEWIPIKTLRRLSAIASCLLITKIYDWLRLFTETSFYVQLVTQTI